MNLLNGRTIEIYLPDGNPKNIRIARDTVRPLNVIAFTITELENLKNRLDEVNGCYLLCGTDIDGKEQVYIGETDNLFKRMKDHRDKKDFWDSAYVILNDSGTFDKGHLHYLENLMIMTSKEAGRFEVLNGNKGQKSTITEQKEAECLNYYESIKLLLSTLGVDVFKKIANVENSINNTEYVFEYTGSKNQWSGKCKMIDNLFFVLKGSLVRKEPVNHVKNNPQSPILKMRRKFIEEGIIVENGEYYEFTTDYAFKSPSLAAAALSGRHDNGWEKWKDAKTGKTLDELFRRDNS